MIRYLFFAVFIATGIGGFSQSYKNEWIDYSKTYYKFPVAAEGLFRISETVLTSLNLGSVNAQDFQLWRDGKEQPIYTTEATGPLSSAGYIEFYGRPLDGSLDSELFPNSQYHVYNDLSFFSDTAWYYLTVNAASANLRFTNEVNTVASTTLLSDSFFMHTNSVNFFRGGYSYNYNYGYAMVPPGATPDQSSYIPIRSSIWDQGEGFASTPFNASSPLSINFSTLQAYTNGPAMSIFYSVVGGWSYNRTVTISMNDSAITSVYVPDFQLRKGTITGLPLSRITNDATVIKFISDYATWPEYSQANALYFTYPRIFNFSSAKVFSFKLPSNPNGNHLRIGKFSQGTLPAVLLDLTNLKRYTAVTKGTDSSLIAIQPSTTDRKLVLVNQADYLKQVAAASIKPVQFTDYSNVANQGDFLIITSNRLRDPYNGNDMVEAYRQYRSSAAGGGFNVQVVDVEQLYDQYAQGVRKNPLSIRHFLQYAARNFTVKPKFVLLLGRGVDYLADRYSGNYQGREYQNSVPTWGSPASDNLLAADTGLNPTPLIPIARLSVVNGKEINDYLDKLKQYEALGNQAAFTTGQKLWKKEAIQLVGGDDTYFAGVLSNFMTYYRSIISDTLIGADVHTYVKSGNTNFPNDLMDLTNRINNGVGLINYFGHSSSSSIDFNLSSPDAFTNSDGKYPIFIANGCSAGNIFFINANRLSYYGLSISERFVLAPKRGSIAFISNSNYGLYNYLNQFTLAWFKNAARTNYAKGIGAIQQAATRNTISITGPTDFYNRVNCEQGILHGDPAAGYATNNKPDYTVTDSLVSITPLNATVAEDTLQVKVTFLNLGQAIRDSVWVDINREFPDGSAKTIGTFMLRNLKFKDSVMLKIPVKGIFDKGTNYIVATIDPANNWDEMSETNNTIRVPFEVSDEEIRPVYPYNFMIVNNTGFHLTGSTVNAVQDMRTYRIQIDTTEMFNSPLLYTHDTTTLGGAVDFKPTYNWVNGTVYYWRIAPVFSGIPVNWRSSSFHYLQGMYSGWGQSHFYQHTKSTFKDLYIDSTTRAFKFKRNLQNLYIVNSIYNYSGDEDNHFSISVNGLTDIYSACVGHSIIFNIFDTLTFQPWTNYNQRYGSGPFCQQGREYNFEFPYYPAASRKTIMDFIDSIPKGMIVTARLILDPPFDSSLIKYWLKDTAIFGAGRSLYHSLYRQGFYKLDSMYKYRTFSAVFMKDDSITLKPDSRVSDGLYDRLNSSYFVSTIDSAGEVASPKFGPSASWHQMQWMGHQPPVDSLSSISIQLIGIDSSNKETVLRTYAPGQWENDISDVDAHIYPYLRLKMLTQNSKQAQPYQLDYWRLFYQPVADGALSALDSFAFNGPYILAGKNVKITLAFKNVGNALLDSCSVRVTVANRNGNQQVFDLPKTRPLMQGDTAMINFDMPSTGMLGKYYAYIQVNREGKPVEQYMQNNFTYIPFELDAVLPATILEFTATPQNSAVRLDWKVTNEKGVINYVVEHSTSNSRTFTAIGGQTAINQGADQAYTMLDQSPDEGANYYRIKTIDSNGNIRYSPIREVFFSRQGKLVVVYPNPFRDIIYVNASGDSNWQFEMFNVQGQRLVIKNGSGNATINASMLPAGTYLVKITDSHGVNTLKFQKHY